jgi:hypothetical protein
MSSFDALIPILLRASVLVLISGLAMIGILRQLRPNSARVHRLVWAGVLINGVLLAPLTVDLPWLEPPVVGSVANSMEPAGGLSDMPSIAAVDRSRRVAIASRRCRKCRRFEATGKRRFRRGITRDGTRHTFVDSEHDSGIGLAGRSRDGCTCRSRLVVCAATALAQSNDRGIKLPG